MGNKVLPTAIFPLVAKVHAHPSHIQKHSKISSHHSINSESIIPSVLKNRSPHRNQVHMGHSIKSSFWAPFLPIQEP